MLNALRRCTPFAAPATAAALLSAFLLVDGRGFDRSAAAAVGLCSAAAAARLVPRSSLAFAGMVLLAQLGGLFPGVMMSGVLCYVAIPVAVFFASLGHRGLPWLLPVLSVLLSLLVTANWLGDSVWLNFVFGNALGEGLMRSLVYGGLVLGASTALCISAWAAAHAVVSAANSRAAQLRAEASLQLTHVELAVEQERNRIARELHDVLAHSLTVIAAQAEGIRFIHRSEPDAVEEAAGVIAAAARTALRDTRHMLSRSPGGQNPAPTLGDLPELARQFRASGMPVTVEGGQDLALSPSQQLTLYRLAQESLTNAFKHGRRESGAKISLSSGQAGVELQVVSALADRPAMPSREGRGIRGMKERATAVGGSVSAVAAAGHFTVTAVLP
ncbi:sensor histidine kinase [Arthrobacter silvisoli]|uniref:sensor histidine kinase n=1 Tax=Arthrobacter silvisoli TaxID=2291022 RepID=UPI000E219423|nr:histidine kinase [Arthrobacter silvisoli]